MNMTKMEDLEALKKHPRIVWLENLDRLTTSIFGGDLGRIYVLDVQDPILTTKAIVEIKAELSGRLMRSVVLLSARSQNLDQVLDLQKQIHIFRILDVSKEELVIEDLKDALAELEKKDRQLSLKANLSKTYRELDQLNQGLESIVQERTAELLLSQREEEERLGRVRALTKFINELSEVNSLEEFLLFIRKDLKKHQRVGDPILVFQPDSVGSHIYYLSSGQMVCHTSSEHLDLE